jgi:hypothetical protein
LRCSAAPGKKAREHQRFRSVITVRDPAISQRIRLKRAAFARRIESLSLAERFEEAS